MLYVIHRHRGVCVCRGPGNTGVCIHYLYHDDAEQGRAGPGTGCAALLPAACGDHHLQVSLGNAAGGLANASCVQVRARTLLFIPSDKPAKQRSGPCCRFTRSQRRQSGWTARGAAP